ncbi:related to protein GRR1 [Cephalotrichum gorgonifer]|uniref:Related to protein GRR1 n=1 Tax=Cephalotrichum gorgonifer TaxID=2041049 RepID=A0AAE8MRE9_9PEZI|nr:related to protein GRR1 [Cephalotrichum gorgonifer]
MAATASASASPGTGAGAVADSTYQDSRSSSSASSPVAVDPENEESDFFLVNNDSESSLSVPNIQAMHVHDPLPEDDIDQGPIRRLPNEILICIFAKLEKPSEVLQCMLTCKRWARNAVDLLWHRPLCSTWPKFKAICRAMQSDSKGLPPFFAYHDFIKRLNLAALASELNDGSVMALSVCNRVERLTLTNCRGLHDGGIMGLVENNSSLLALDISGASQITEKTIVAIAENCKRLQGLNISGCHNVSNESMIELAKACRYIKRLKLNGCHQLRDEAIQAFADNCRNILEIDLHECINVSNAPITSLFLQGQALRELRLAGCELVSDSAFLSLPPNRTYENLRILDLTACTRLTDAAVQKIIDVAPRLRNVVLSKCRNITDVAVHAISKLGKNLHYIHLGHCGQITDEAVKRLVHSCNRIRYIDLGCCTNLTDDSVMRLATLPKLKRIGLVKCSNITDESVIALARSHRARTRRDAQGNVIGEDYYVSSLERVHLSYCLNLTLKSIIRLLNACPRLTHLSLTGVAAFLRNEFQQFGRDPPVEFTENQRQVFCVFSGTCVKRLREYLNDADEYKSLRESTRHRPSQAVQTVPPVPPAWAAPAHWPPHGIGSAVEDVADDDMDGMLEGSDLGPVPLPPPPPPVALGLAPPGAVPPVVGSLVSEHEDTPDSEA